MSKLETMPQIISVEIEEIVEIQKLYIFLKFVFKIFKKLNFDIN